MICTTLRYTAPQWNTLHYTSLHFTTPCTTLNYNVILCTTLHYTALHCTGLPCTILDYTALHCTAPRVFKSRRDLELAGRFIGCEQVGTGTVSWRSWGILAQGVIMIWYVQWVLTREFFLGGGLLQWLCAGRRSVADWAMLGWGKAARARETAAAAPGWYRNYFHDVF